MKSDQKTRAKHVMSQHCLTWEFDYKTLVTVLGSGWSPFFYDLVSSASGEICKSELQCIQPPSLGLRTVLVGNLVHECVWFACTSGKKQGKSGQLCWTNDRGKPNDLQDWTSGHFPSQIAFRILAVRPITFSTNVKLAWFNYSNWVG